MDDRSYYVIRFEDKMSYHIGANRVKTEGTIYIDALNFGVKKINYLATLVTGASAIKLYELTVEYVLKGYKYYLNYISYNTLLRTPGFVFTGAVTDNHELTLAFSRDLNAKKRLFLKILTLPMTVSGNRLNRA